MIQFIDVGAQYKILKKDIDDNIQKVLNHGKFIMGPEISELENKLSEYVGVKHCISTSSGTDALLMPLMAWGLGAGDAVFTTTFTFAATAEVISLLGATPVFADIDPDTFNLDPEKLGQAIKKVFKEGQFTPKAIIPVDLFGLPADYDKIEAIAKKYQLKILEDAAQGFGGLYKRRRAGAFGDAAVTSFFPAKPLGCYGDGGAIFTENDELAAVLKSIRIHGKGKDKYDNIRIGLNARLDTLQAAILLPKLRAFIQYEFAARNKFAEMYTEGLEGILKTPTVPDGLTSSWAQYSVLAKDEEERAMLQEKLKESGIPTMIYYCKPLHLQTAYANLGYKKGDFPVTEDVCSRIFSLPMHPYLTEDIIENIVTIIKKCLSN
ncbi:UDP-2-acetamido-2-deoxy-3-oxo-D-glucuronate aminotransferase [subsurface metagenome]|jgi:dTDP-4-amino-4,6-dideoxygalactose transaminase